MMGSSSVNMSNMTNVFDQQKFDRMDPMQNQQCRVCAEPAAGFHFGAFTCEGCKSFFGRTCNNQAVIQECKNNYRCVVDKKNRTSCKACRLRKCLMVGMSKSGSRYGRRSNWFKIHCLMQQNTPPQSSHDPPAVVPNHAWPPKRDDSSSEQRDSSFGSSSRSPSPLNTSFDSYKKSSSSSPPKADSLSPTPLTPSPIKPPPQKAKSPEPIMPHFPPTSPLASLYGSALSNPISFMSGGAFPFYKLSPLLAAHNPLLANPFLLSMNQRSHLDILQEHRELLAKFGVQQQSSVAASPHYSLAVPRATSPPNLKHEPRSPDNDRPVSPPTTHNPDTPIDLSVKISATTTCFIQPSSPLSHLQNHPSPVSSCSPDDEGIEVDIAEKSDKNRNLLGASNFEERRDALDLTVSS